MRVGKARKYDKESVFRERKRFHLLKSLLYKNGKAENMAVVAGRLVAILKQLIVFFSISAAGAQIWEPLLAGIETDLQAAATNLDTGFNSNQFYLRTN